MTDQLLLLGIGFLLTSVLGGALGFIFQRRAWAHQHETERREEQRRQAFQVFEEISSLMDKRLYRMRLLYWSGKARAQGEEGNDLNASLDAYRDVLLTWNDNLNRSSALTEVYFGGGVRSQLERVYEEFAAVGRALDAFIRAASGGETVKVPPLGRRLSQVGFLVYRMNLRMLRLLQEDALGKAAPEASTGPGGSALLEFGHEGPAVRRLQVALRRSGAAALAVDGVFGPDTERALRTFQRSADLPPDAIAGPQTWAKLDAGNS